MSETEYNMPAVLNGLANEDPSVGRQQILRQAAQALSAQAAQIEALTKALKTIRFCWAGHAEECAYAKSKYRRQCDCDWPKVSAECDAALAAVGEKK